MLGKTRTLNPQIRSLVLYPIELQAHTIESQQLSHRPSILKHSSVALRSLSRRLLLKRAQNK